MRSITILAVAASLSLLVVAALRGPQAPVVRPPAREDVAASPSTAPPPPAAPPAPGEPRIRLLRASGPCVITGPGMTDEESGLGADDLRFMREAAEAVLRMRKTVAENGLAALLGGLSETALGGDGRRFYRDWMALRWKLEEGASDWGLVEGFALDPARPLVARRAALQALAEAKRGAVRDLLLGWFHDPRFLELRATLLGAVLAAEAAPGLPIEAQAEEMLRCQARDAGIPMDVAEPGSPQTPKSRESLDLVMGVAETESGTEAARAALGILGGWLQETHERLRWAEGQPVDGGLLDTRTEARAGAALLRAAGGRDEVERSIALLGLEALPTEEADRFWIGRYEGATGEERRTYAQEAARRTALRDGWRGMERMLDAEGDVVARGCLLASFPEDAARPPEMLAWLERTLRTERDPWIRSLALDQVARFGDAARDVLTEATGDGDTHVSEKAGAALRSLEGQ